MRAWRERILAEYERLAGRRSEGLEFFKAYSCLKRPYSIVASLAYGAESLGVRSGAEAAMRQHTKPLYRVYQMLLARTGVRIPEEEFLLAAK